MQLFYLALIAFLWGTGNVLVKRGLIHLTAWQSFALDAVCIAFPIWMIYGLLAGGNLLTATPLAIGTALLVSVFYAFNYYTFSIGAVSLTGSIISSYPILTLILAYIFLHERLHPLALMGVILTILGVVFISLPHKKVRFGPWVYFAIFTAAGYGVTSYFAKVVLASVNNATYLMLLAITQVLIVSGWKVKNSAPIPRVHWHTFKYSIIGIILLNFGNIAYYIALEQGLASLVVPLSIMYVPVMVIISMVWLKEKLYLQQLVGIAMAVVGVVFAGLF